MTYPIDSKSSMVGPEEMAIAFRRWGWAGFWGQLALAAVPVAILLFATLVSPPRQGLGNAWLGVFLGYAALLVLIFTIYWCFRYTRIARDLEDPDYRPSRARVTQELWIGLLANAGGMACAVMLAMWKVGTLLFRLLSVPQNATLLAPEQGGTVVTRGALIVPLDMISLQAMVNTIAAELVGILVTLWLLRLILQR
jgi:hypothetical protein